MADAWDYGPGNVDDFSLGGFLSSFSTAAAQSASAINSVRRSVESVQAPLVQQNTRTDGPVKPVSLPWYVWVFGGLIVYQVVK